MKGSDFIFGSVRFVYYKCQRGGSYIDSPEWIKKTKATITLKRDDDICFQ